MSKKPSTSSRTAAKAERPAKIPQKHGGALYAGGVPGHQGAGAGRRRNDVREMLLGGAAQAVPVLLAHLRSDDAALAQNAADKLLKYGVGPPRDDTVPADDVRDRLKATIDIIRRVAPMGMADEILQAMQPVWT